MFVLFYRTYDVLGTADTRLMRIAEPLTENGKSDTIMEKRAEEL
jgi:hypothetical protein